METQPLDDRDVAPWVDEGDDHKKEREADYIEMDLYPSEGYSY